MNDSKHFIVDRNGDTHCSPSEYLKKLLKGRDEILEDNVSMAYMGLGCRYWNEVVGEEMERLKPELKKKALALIQQDIDEATVKAKLEHDEMLLGAAAVSDEKVKHAVDGSSKVS